MRTQKSRNQKSRYSGKSEDLSILGLDFQVHDTAAARRKISGFLDTQTGACVFTPNACIALSCAQEPALAREMNRAALLLPDGIGIPLAARLLGQSGWERVTGIDTAQWVMQSAADRGLSLFLLGGKPGVAKAAAQNLRRRYPGLCIAGCHHGYFAKSGTENDALLRKIRVAKPDILFVCFGFPAQEWWCLQNAPLLPGLRLCMGLGGSLDVWAGRVRRAPKAVRSLGCEWLWRSLQSPEHFARLAELPAFLLSVVKEKKRALP